MLDRRRGMGGGAMVENAVAVVVVIGGRLERLGERSRGAGVFDEPFMGADAEAECEM